MIDKWLDSRFGDVVPASGGSDVRVDCPFCKARAGKDDTKKHLYVSTVKTVAHCFKCEWSGTHVQLVMNVDGISYVEAIQCMEDPSVDITDFNVIGRKLKSPRGLIQTEYEDVPPGFHIMLRHGTSDYEMKAVRKYLIRRRIPKDIANYYFGTVRGTLRAWMLIDKHWWQGRHITNAEPKYISPPWPIGDSLWNGQALEIYDDVIACEGVISSIGVYRETKINNAVALCGKNLTELQAERIVRANIRSMTLMFDADAIDLMYIAAETLISKGFDGKLHLHKLHRADPAISIEGITEEYTWGSKVYFDLGLV